MHCKQNIENPNSFTGSYFCTVFHVNVFSVSLSYYILDFKLQTYPPMKTEQTECSETSAYKIQTPGNYPEESLSYYIYIYIYISFYVRNICKKHLQ